MRRPELYGITSIDLFELPYIDLSHMGVLINYGNFKDSGLDKLTGKSHDSSIAPTWYADKHYDEIVNLQIRITFYP